MLMGLSSLARSMFNAARRMMPRLAAAVILAGMVGIFAELHIKHPVLLVLDEPVLADGCGDALGVADVSSGSSAARR